jgi:hypothetical protein
MPAPRMTTDLPAPEPCGKFRWAGPRLWKVDQAERGHRFVHRRRAAGQADWQDEKRSETRRTLDLTSLPNHVRAGKGGKELAGTIAAIFNHVRHPIEFDELVSAVAALLGISDQPLESLAEDEDAVASVGDSAEPDPAWRIEKRMFLQRLWEELEQLPRNQRTALLLNLKETSGFGCITLFPATGIASVRQLAAAVEMTPESFAELWNDLPLEDAKIAELLGLTRQQVINARKSGRERLTRRLRGFI